MTGFVMRRRSHVRAAGFYTQFGSWGDSPETFPLTGQGALASAVAVLAGEGTVKFTGQGALDAVVATLVGDGQGDPAFGNGDISAQAATMAGSGAVT